MNFIIKYDLNVTSDISEIKNEGIFYLLFNNNKNL